MANVLENLAPPAIPYAPAQYTRTVFDQRDNVFRLFFNRIIATLRTVLSVEDGGKFLYFPRGLFYSTQIQTIASSNDPTPITYNETYIGNGVRVENNSEIHISADGVYNFQLSAQIDKTAAATKEVFMWIRKNGSDIPWSSHKYAVSGSPAETVAIWVFNIDMAAGDWIEIIFTSSDTSVQLTAEAATLVHPGIPSAVMAVSFVSNL
jgi:hypothetical protein